MRPFDGVSKSYKFETGKQESQKRWEILCSVVQCVLGSQPFPPISATLGLSEVEKGKVLFPRSHNNIPHASNSKYTLWQVNSSCGSLIPKWCLKLVSYLLFRAWRCPAGSWGLSCVHGQCPDQQCSKDLCKCETCICSGCNTANHEFYPGNYLITWNYLAELFWY